MAGGVRNKKTFGRKIKGHDKDIENLYGLLNSEGNPSAAAAGKSIIAGTSPGVKSTFLPLQGGQMQGPIGFRPESIIITAGNLRLNQNSAGDTIKIRQIIFVAAESGGVDDLDTIEGRLFFGQSLTLVGIAGNTITIKHNNTSAESADERAILCPNGDDFVLEEWMAIDLFFDDVNNKWRIKGGSGGGGGAGTYKAPCRVAAAVNISNLALMAELQDGVTLIEGDRILLRFQTTGSENGIYDVGVVTTGFAPLTRSIDLDNSDEALAGVTTYIEEGTTHKDTMWGVSTDNAIVLDTDDMNWIKIGNDYRPTSNQLVGDVLTVSADSNQRFVVLGEGGVDDDIQFVEIEFPKQDALYSVQGTTGVNLTFINETITAPPDGNHRKIRTTNSADFTMSGNQNILMIYDSSADQFVVIGSGNEHDPIILNETNKGNVTGAINIDWSAGNFHRMVLTGDTNISFLNMPVTGKYEQIVVQFQQDPTGGHVVTWNDIFTNDNEPLVSIAADVYSVVTFYTYDDGVSDQFFGFNTTQVTSMAFALSDETSQLGKTSATKPVLTFRMPHKMVIADIRSSLSKAGTSGGPTILEIEMDGVSILDASRLRIDQLEKSSVTAGFPVTVTTDVLTDDAEITVFMTAKSKGATGLKLYLIGFI